MSTTLDLLARGRALLADGDDPLGDIRSAMIATDVLLLHGGALDDIEDAARAGLDVARDWGIDSETSMALRANVALARIRVGQVIAAEAVLGVGAEEPPDPDRWMTHSVRAAVDVRLGHVDSAAHRIHVLLSDVLVHDEIDLDILCIASDVDFWRGSGHGWLRPSPARPRRNGGPCTVPHRVPGPRRSRASGGRRCEEPRRPGPRRAGRGAGPPVPCEPRTARSGASGSTSLRT